MTVAAIKAGLLEWIENELGITVIFSEQNSPRPAKPYAVLRLLNLGKVGQDWNRGVDGAGIMTLKGLRNVVSIVTVLGPDAHERARLLQQSLEKPTVQERLYYTHGLAVLNEGTVTNVTALLEVDYEERAELESRFGYSSEYTDDVGLIEKVELTNQIDEPDTTTIVEI